MQDDRLTFFMSYPKSLKTKEEKKKGVVLIGRNSI